MKASIRAKVRNHKGKYEVVIISKDELNGKYKYKRVGLFDDESEARYIEEITQKKIDEGEDVLNKKKVSKITLNECIEGAFKKEESRGDKVSANTFLSYRNIYNNHISKDIGQTYIQQLTTGMVQDLLDEKAKEYGYGMVSQIKTVIRKGVQYALYRDYIKHDVTSSLIVWGKQSKTSAEINCLNMEQISYILEDTKDTELGLKILLAFGLGLRESEVLAMSWDNIDLEEETLKVCQIVVKKDGKHIIQKFTKNKNDLVVKMPDFIVKALKEYKAQWNEWQISTGFRDNENLLFYGKNFKVIPTATLSNQFKRYMMSLGIENVTFHGLRHSYASYLFHKGMDLKTVGQMLNHKSKYCTDRVYVHLVDEAKGQAVDVMNEILL